MKYILRFYKYKMKNIIFLGYKKRFYSILKITNSILLVIISESILKGKK